MQHLTSTIQRTEAALKDSEWFTKSLNLVLADLFQIVTNRLQG